MEMSDCYCLTLLSVVGTKVLDISASAFRLRNGGSFSSLEGNYMNKSVTALELLDIIK